MPAKMRLGRFDLWLSTRQHAVTGVDDQCGQIVGLSERGFGCGEVRSGRAVEGFKTPLAAYLALRRFLKQPTNAGECPFDHARTGPRCTCGGTAAAGSSR